MTVTSATAARKAVIAALTTETGMPHALPSASLFRRATPARSGSRPIVTKVKKRCTVIFAASTVDEAALAGVPLVGVVYRVDVICDYYAGSDLFSAEDDDAKESYEADEHIVRAALTAPGELQTASLALAVPADTGLDGGALRLDGARMIVTPPRREDKERVYRVTHTFVASIEITNT